MQASFHGNGNGVQRADLGLGELSQTREDGTLSHRGLLLGHLNELSRMCLRIVQECWLLIILPIHIHSAPLSWPSPSLAFSLPGLLSYAFSPNEEESRLEGEVGITSRASLALGSDVLEPVWVPGLFVSVSFNGLS